MILTLPLFFALCGRTDTSYLRRYEHRNPDSFPSWSGNSRFSNQVESYFKDRLWGRYHLLRILAEIKYRMQTSIDPERVLIGRNGWLYLANRDMLLMHRNLIRFRGKEGLTVESLSSQISKFQKWCAQHGTTLLLVLLPRKQDIYPEFLPRWASIKSSSLSSVEEMLESLKKYHVNFIDLRPVLLEDKEKGELYFPLDMHWNSLGAFVASQAITREAYRLREILWCRFSH